jgi:hypothetical protein
LYSYKGDIFPEKSIPMLVKSYENPNKSLENRLKIGESLLDVAERYIYQK